MCSCECDLNSDYVFCFMFFVFVFPLSEEGISFFFPEYLLRAIRKQTAEVSIHWISMQVSNGGGKKQSPRRKTLETNK